MMFRNRWNVQPTARNTPSGGTAGSAQNEIRLMEGVWRHRHGVKHSSGNHNSSRESLTEDRQYDLKNLHVNRTRISHGCIRCMCMTGGAPHCERRQRTTRSSSEWLELLDDQTYCIHERSQSNSCRRRQSCYCSTTAQAIIPRHCRALMCDKHHGTFTS